MAKPFTFRMRVYAAAHFEYEEELRVRWPDALAVFQSEYTGGDDGLAYPVTIHGEIRGDSETLDDAQDHLTHAIGSVLRYFALSANAALDAPCPIIVHGLDLSEPQPFMAYETPVARDWFPPGVRKIAVQPTIALLKAARSVAAWEILDRAVEMYSEALTHWTPEERLLAGEFLYIAAETLSRFLVESRAASREITPKNLAQLEGHKNVGALRQTYLTDEIFARNTPAITAIEQASNGFEHGYMNIEKIHGLFRSVLEDSFGYVRRALIEATGIEEDMAKELLGPEYAEPRGLVPVIRVITGELAMSDPSLPPPDMDTPVELLWETPHPTAEKDEDGKVTLTFDPMVTAESLPSNITMRIKRHGMRAANVEFVEKSETHGD